jgi:adenosylhomocysteine nucleosidase
VTGGNSSLQSAALPTSLWVGGGSAGQSNTLLASLWGGGGSAGQSNTLLASLWGGGGSAGQSNTLLASLWVGGGSAGQSTTLLASLWGGGGSTGQSNTLLASLWVDDDSVRQSATSASFPRVCGVVVALPEELATLTSQKPAQGECVWMAENILLTLAGAGPINADRAARRLIAQGANCLISWGCAAALAPQLKPGDLVVPQRVLSEHQAFDTDKQWLQHLRHLSSPIPTVSGALAESSRIVAGSADKQRIHQDTGAVALDMESAAVVKAAQQANLPVLVIRAIADPVAMDLPQSVVHALNDQGRVELSKLLRFLLTHPWEIPALIKLGLHFNAAQTSLKKVAKQLNEIIHF